MILVIDNYDSFVYNLARYVHELGYAARVVRNNAITLSEITLDHYSHIIISPGPCAPQQAGMSLDIIKTLKGKIPILGVCLGHQAIGEAYGGRIQKAIQPLHGKASKIFHNREGLFLNIPSPFNAGRYHSLIVEEQSLPHELLVTARSENGEIMALQHREHAVYGVQFHPESVLTEHGHVLLKNFLENMRGFN